MFSNINKSISKNAVQLLPTGTRGFATEKQLKLRMNAIKGIGKITKAMRMVALAKLRRSQDQLERARAFANPLETVWPEPAKQPENFTAGSTVMIVPVIADRGLCGGANSGTNRAVKRHIAKIEGDKASPLLVIYGEKGRGGLERAYKKYFATTISDWSKNKILGFRQVGDLTQHVLENKFDRGDIFYNRFKNMMVYNQISTPLLPLETAIAETKFDSFEMEGEAEILRNLYEYRLGARLYHYMAENETSELSARMAAMGNSSKSAEEMLVKVRMLYNRTRQSRITTELVEIIGGVVSMEDASK